LKKINIAIDGYSSCGKGTLAKQLAKQLGYKFIDSGAMYRAVTWYLLEHNIPVEDESEVAVVLPKIDIDFEINPSSGRSDVLVNALNIETQIRTMRVAEAVSQVAKLSSVRRYLVELQKQMGIAKGVVMDGRDIGTVVFPDAELKIFMTATPEIRAQRRFEELNGSGVDTSYNEVLKNLQSRDFVDSSREDSPLTLTTAYNVLDNSGLSQDEQFGLAMKWVETAIGG
jgi:cytidylate kinase